MPEKIVDQAREANALWEFVVARTNEDAKAIRESDGPGAEIMYWGQVARTKSGIEWIDCGFRYVAGMVHNLLELREFASQWRDHPGYPGYPGEAPDA